MAVELPDYLKEQALNPEWEKAGKVHDWRNYVNGNIRALWPTFTEEQKCALVEQAEDRAGDENWD